MTRKEKIELIKKILSGELSLSELVEKENEGTGVNIFIEGDTRDSFIDQGGTVMTGDEIERMPGWKIMIVNPHLNHEDLHHSN